jgi:two-component system, LuxR family, sensor kinase FixL
MKSKSKTKDELLLHVEDLEMRLEEAEEILRAVRNDEVDAVVVSGADGERVYTLKEASQPYRIFVESMSEGALTLTADGTIYYCNKRFSEIIRTPLEKIIGSSMDGFIAQEDQERVRTIFDQGSRGETCLRAADGTLVPVHLSISPFLRFDENMVVCAVVTDLTEQKQHEQILAAERLSRAILDQAAEAIVVCDKEGSILRASRRARELCGKNPFIEPFESVFPLQRNSADGGMSLEFDLSDAMGGKLVNGAEVAFKREDGHVRDLLVNAGPLLSEKEEVLGCIVVMKDITERRHAEEELRRAKDDLEIRVLERTADLERRNQELQEFAFVASHDLQEPLRKVQTFGEMLAKKSATSLGAEGRDYIRRMQKAAARMQKLLGSLLSYSRVTTKSEPFTQTDLRQSVGGALSNLEVLIKDKGALVKVDALPTLEADRPQMIQLFQNLIGNALKFQRENETPRVSIYSGRSGKGEGRKQREHEIRVEDNGIGFDEKYLDKIFVPFQRLHGRNDYEGLGMGLAICKKIVERHGGQITARSELGKGSTFIVTLPAKQKPVISNQ